MHNTISARFEEKIYLKELKAYFTNFVQNSHDKLEPIVRKYL